MSTVFSSCRIRALDVFLNETAPRDTTFRWNWGCKGDKNIFKVNVVVVVAVVVVRPVYKE